MTHTSQEMKSLDHLLAILVDSCLCSLPVIRSPTVEHLACYDLEHTTPAFSAISAAPLTSGDPILGLSTEALPNTHLVLSHPCRWVISTGPLLSQSAPSKWK